MSGERPPPGSDAELMVLVGRGDRQAFRTLYDLYGGPVMRFLFRLCRERSVAEDLTQETFLRVWTHAARWEPRGRLTTWIFQIAKRLWWKQRARARNRLRREEVSARRSGARTSDPDPLARLEARDEAARLAEALAGLSPRLRLVFVLIRLEGLSYAETARIADIRLGTAKSRMAAAEASLRRLLGREERGKHDPETR